MSSHKTASAPKWHALLNMTAIALACLWSAQLAYAQQTIQSGAVVYDNTGARVYAGSGDIFKSGEFYYWFGEDYQKYSYPGSGPSEYYVQFENVKCYRSADLKNWEFRNNVLTRQPSGDLGTNREVSRPKVVYNAATAKWVMLWHFENDYYNENMIGLATSDAIDGDYTYVKKFYPRGNYSFDFSVYQEGADCYIIYSKNNGYLTIDKLTPDYMDVESPVATDITTNGEAPTMFKRGSIYYLLYSQLSGWAPNANKYRTASSLAGPWSEEKDLAPSSSDTFSSQVFEVITVADGSVNGVSPGYIFVGDMFDVSNLPTSKSLWLPLTIGADNELSLNYVDAWTVDVNPGGPVPVASLAISPASSMLAINSSLQLTAVIAPSTATNQDVTWNSSNPNVASVSQSGLVTGVANGAADVTATSVTNGVVATSSITVAAAATADESGPFMGWKEVGSQVDVSGENAINAFQHTAGSNLTVDRIKIHINAGSGGKLRLAIYRDDNDNPGPMLAQTEERSNVDAGWQIFNLDSAVALTAGNKYWLAEWTDDNEYRVNTEYAGGKSWFKTGVAALPAAITTPATSTNSYQYSMYAEMAPAGKNKFLPDRYRAEAKTALPKDAPVEDALVVYPIPAQEVLYTKAGADTDGAVIALADLSGKVVRETLTTGRTTPLDVRQLPAGVYVLSVRTKTKLLHKRVVIDRK